MNKRFLILSGAFFAAFLVFTILLTQVDVAPICPDGVSRVGFSHVNRAFQAATVPMNRMGTLISKVSGLVGLATVPLYALVGFLQLLKSRKFASVDRRLYLLAGFYVVVFAANAFFEHVLPINCRPVFEEDGTLEASYPSSHTLLAICLLGSSWGMLRCWLAEKSATRWLKPAYAVHVLFMFLIIVGRLVSGVHWLTDILGGILLGTAMLLLFYGWLQRLHESMRSS